MPDVLTAHWWAFSTDIANADITDTELVRHCSDYRSLVAWLNGSTTLIVYIVIDQRTTF